MQADVIIPYFNRPELLMRAVKSVLLHPFIKNIIIVDDNSDKKLKSDYFSQIGEDVCRIKLVDNQFSKGAQYARLYGVTISDSDFVIFLDSDDELLLSGLDILQHKVINNHGNFSLFYGDLFISNRVVRTPRFRGYKYNEILGDLSLCPFSGLCVERKAIKIDLLLLDLPSWQDDDFIITISKDYSVMHIGCAIARMFQTNDSISSNKIMQLIGLRMLLTKWKPELYRVFGFFKVLLWKLREIRILWLAKAQNASYEAEIASKKYKIIILKLIDILYRIAATILYLFLRPFFNKIYT